MEFTATSFVGTALRMDELTVEKNIYFFAVACNSFLAYLFKVISDPLKSYLQLEFQLNSFEKGQNKVFGLI